jgi:Ca2+-binding RTX toxin-like protein
VDGVYGGPGNDKVYGDAATSASRHGKGRGRVRGNWANRLHGGDGNDLVVGTPEADLMSGGKGDDKQFGGAGDDRIFANLGVDETFGGDGNDDLWALARGDVNGPNDTQGDTLHGQLGNDTFHVRDGEQDVVDCGAGDDTVIADFKDVVTTDCEHVQRAVPSNKEDSAEKKQESPRNDSKES